MEGIVIYKRCSLFFILFIAPFSASSKVLKVVYFNKIFGHVHQNPSRYSQSLSTVSCGHPVKVLGKTKEWSIVKVGPYKGHIQDMNLSSRRPYCFQDRYPKFFNDFKLTVTEMYYWGRLYDLYSSSKTTVR